MFVNSRVDYKFLERLVDNAWELKRRALGLCGSVVVKSESELVNLLVRCRIGDSVEDARRKLPYFDDVLVEYGLSWALKFERVSEGYRIERVMLEDEAFDED